MSELIASNLPSAGENPAEQDHESPAINQNIPSRERDGFKYEGVHVTVNASEDESVDSSDDEENDPPLQDSQNPNPVSSDQGHSGGGERK